MTAGEAPKQRKRYTRVAADRLTQAGCQHGPVIKTRKTDNSEKEIATGVSWWDPAWSDYFKAAAEVPWPKQAKHQKHHVREQGKSPAEAGACASWFSRHIEPVTLSQVPIR